MPLHWTIDPQDKLITAVAEGDITRGDFEAFLNASKAAGAQHYRKLFDGTRGTLRMASEDIMALGARMRASHETATMGALAAVVPDGDSEAISRVLGMLAAADRRMRVFRQVATARRWIAGLPR